MERVVQFLKEAETYYLATVEGDQPRVRPFGTAHIFEGKLYIQTGKVKDVSKQIHTNPKVEICAFKNGEWLRVAGELVEDDREVFCILNMKNNGQVINMNLVSVGTINASLVIPREVFKSSILANASAIIGLHNHPSGNVKPSKEDMIVTRKLQKCGQLLGIELLDHIIVGGTNGKMLSFREEKMLNVTGSRTFK